MTVIKANHDDVLMQLRLSSAAKGISVLSDEVRQISLNRIVDFESQAVSRKTSQDVYLEATPKGLKLFSAKNIQGLLPELDLLIDESIMNTIAVKLFNPTYMITSQDVFCRNPGGQPICPHQDIIYESSQQNQRTLSLSIKLTPVTYNQGHMSYHSVKFGESLNHHFDLKNAQFTLNSFGGARRRLLELEEPDIESIWHTSFSIHQSRKPTLGNYQGVFVRYIVNCYGSTI